MLRRHDAHCIIIGLRAENGRRHDEDVGQQIRWEGDVDGDIGDELEGLICGRYVGLYKRSGDVVRHSPMDPLVITLWISKDVGSQQQPRYEQGDVKHNGSIVPEATYEWL